MRARLLTARRSAAAHGHVADLLQRYGFVGGQVHLASVAEPASFSRLEEHRDRVARGLDTSVGHRCVVMSVLYLEGVVTVWVWTRAV